MTDNHLRELSARSGKRALAFDYTFGYTWRHRLFKDGRLYETLDATQVGGEFVTLSFASERTPEPDPGAVRDDPAAYAQSLFKDLKVRDWGISTDQLRRSDLPFPPTLIVESFFVRMA
jgi:hypothetical protein